MTPELAEDLVQETLSAAWQKIRRLHGPLAFLAWLKAILLNTCRMWRRDQRHAGESLETLDGLLAGDGDPLRHLLRGEERQRWWQALHTLPAENRQALLLHVIGCHSYQEIARALQVPLSTVQGRIQRARRQLRRALERTPSPRRVSPVRRQKGCSVMVETPAVESPLCALYLFTRHLASLLDAGLTLPYTLQMTGQDAPAPYNDAARQLLMPVSQDYPLSAAMAAQDGLFPAWYRGMVRPGEYPRRDEGGTLDSVAEILQPLAYGSRSTLLGAGEDWTPALRLSVFTHLFAAVCGSVWDEKYGIRVMLTRDAPEPYAEFVRQAVTPDRPGTSFTQEMAARTDLFTPRYAAMCGLTRAGVRLREILPLLQEMLADEWAFAPATGWQPTEASFFTPPERGLPADIATLTVPQRSLLLRWFCRTLALLLTAQVPLPIAVAQAAFHLPARQQAALQASGEDDSRPLDDMLRQGGVDDPMLAVLAAARTAADLVPLLELVAKHCAARLQGAESPLQTFARLFAWLHEAGIPVHTCLELLAREVSAPYGAASMELAAAVAHGETLAATLEQHADLFPLPYRYIVRLGEEWGQLPYLLRRGEEIVQAIDGPVAAPSGTLAMASRIMGINFSSGINVVGTYTMLAQWLEAPYGPAIQRVLDRVMAGMTIADAMAEQPEHFPPAFLTLVRAGEYGGVLDEAMYQAADMLQDELRFAPLTGWDVDHSPLYHHETCPLPETWEALTWAQQQVLLMRFCRVLTMLPPNGAGKRRILETAARLLPAGLRQHVMAMEWTVGVAESLATLGFLPPLVADLFRIGEPTDRLALLMSKAADLLREQLLAALQASSVTGRS